MYFAAAGDAVTIQEARAAPEERGREGGEEKGLEQQGEAQNEDEERALSQLESMLDVFGDAYLNKHLVYAILELVIVKLIPEMGEMGPEELMAERLG